MSNSGPQQLPSSANPSYITSSPHQNLGLEEKSSLINCLNLSALEEQDKLRGLYPSSSPLLQHYRQFRASVNMPLPSPTHNKSQHQQQLTNFFPNNSPGTAPPPMGGPLFSFGHGSSGPPHFTGHPMRPSPPILPNANARTSTVTQPTVSFPSSINPLHHQTKAMDRMRPFEPNTFPSLFPHPNYSGGTFPHGNSLPSATSLPMSGPNFATFSESQALSHRLNNPRPPPPTGESVDLQSPNEFSGSQQQLVMPTASTEQEVQKLLSIALTNSQQRLEKSCLPSGIQVDTQSVDDHLASSELTVSTSECSTSQNQISSNEAAQSQDDFNSGHSLIIQEKMMKDVELKQEPFQHEEDSDEIEQKPFREYLDDEREKNDSFNQDFECNQEDNDALIKERLTESGSADNWNQSLDVSQETRNAMESSGSPAIDTGDAVDVEESTSYQVTDDEAEDDYPQEMSWSNGENAVSNPTESERLSPDSDDGMTLAKFELFTSSIQPDKEGLFFCHLCEFTGKTRQEFHDHLRSHYDYKCDKCDYTSRTEGRLKRHLKDFHSEVPPQNFSGKTARGSKPKTLKCKQCDFLAQNKDDYWQHQRSHIKEEKRLECPRCPFVTEYKHHLEYHIRNHFGSKPYKCPKCNYMCVNKSMLNSHMKSHTNVYQYRCADCHYATKYCHSLKLHLAKNGHSPATVLNSDGSLPEYDNSSEILNMKRGPPRGQRQNVRQVESSNIRPPQEFNPMLLGSDINPFLIPHHSSAQSQPFAPNTPTSNSIWSFLPPGFPHGFPSPFAPGFNPAKFTGSSPHASLPPTSSSAGDMKPLSMVLPHPNSFAMPGSLTKSPVLHRPGRKTSNFTCTFCNNFHTENLSELSQHMMRDHSFAEAAAKFMMPGGPTPPLPQHKTLPGMPEFKSVQSANSMDQSHIESSSAALDLSCATTISTADAKSRSNVGTPSHVNEMGGALPAESQDSCDSNMQSSPDETDGHEFHHDREDINTNHPTDDGDKPPRKRPRKSKAFHLDDLCARFENQPATELCSVDTIKEASPSSSTTSHNNNNNNFKVTILDQQKKDYYECHYCDILFRGRTLFDIHMGYHCHADPFLCNRCGRQSRDNVEFFTHLGEVPHA